MSFAEYRVAFEPGLPDGFFQTKNPNLGKFWWVLQWKILAYFMTIWSILRLLKIFMVIWYILWSFGIFTPVSVFWSKKNLATLVWTCRVRSFNATYSSTCRQTIWLTSMVLSTTIY
jgi:hypothetical protein